MTPRPRAGVKALNAVTDPAQGRRVIKRARYRRVNARRAGLIYAHTPDDDRSCGNSRR